MEDEERPWTLSLFLKQTPKSFEVPSSLVMENIFVKTDFSYLLSVIVPLYVCVQSPLPTWQWINSRFTHPSLTKVEKKNLGHLPKPAPAWGTSALPSSFHHPCSWSLKAAGSFSRAQCQCLLSGKRSGSLEEICHQNINFDLNALKK